MKMLVKVSTPGKPTIGFPPLTPKMPPAAFLTIDGHSVMFGCSEDGGYIFVAKDSEILGDPNDIVRLTEVDMEKIEPLKANLLPGEEFIYTFTQRSGYLVTLSLKMGI